MPTSSPGGLPNPGVVPRSPALQAGSSPSEPPGKPRILTSQGRVPGEGQERCLSPLTQGEAPRSGEHQHGQLPRHRALVPTDSTTGTTSGARR